MGLGRNDPLLVSDIGCGGMGVVCGGHEGLVVGVSEVSGVQEYLLVLCVGFGGVAAV